MAKYTEERAALESEDAVLIPIWQSTLKVQSLNIFSGPGLF